MNFVSVPRLIDAAPEMKMIMLESRGEARNIITTDMGRAITGDMSAPKLFNSLESDKRNSKP